MAAEKRAVLMAALLAGGVFATTAARATLTEEVTVDGTAAPWLYVPGGLNTDYQYGAVSAAATTVVSSGFVFDVGDVFTVTYLSGSASADPVHGYPYVDAGGETDFIFNANTENSGNVGPSAYMDPATYPIYLMELVGTFADASGGIVGTPFALGDGPTSLIVPAGAAELLLGFNDDIYSDNAGSILVEVSEVPEPGTLLTLTTGLIGLSGIALRRRRARYEA